MYAAADSWSTRETLGGTLWRTPEPACTGVKVHRGIILARGWPTVPVEDGLILSTETKVADMILRRGRARGIDEILVEMLKYGGPALINKMTTLINQC